MNVSPNIRDIINEFIHLTRGHPDRARVERIAEELGQDSSLFRGMGRGEILDECFAALEAVEGGDTFSLAAPPGMHHSGNMDTWRNNAARLRPERYTPTSRVEGGDFHLQRVEGSILAPRLEGYGGMVQGSALNRTAPPPTAPAQPAMSQARTREKEALRRNQLRFFDRSAVADGIGVDDEMSDGASVRGYAMGDIHRRDYERHVMTDPPTVTRSIPPGFWSQLKKNPARSLEY